MSKYLIEFRGLEGLASYFKEFPDLSQQATRLAINSAARFGARLASKAIRAQVNLKRSYIGAAGEENSKIRIRQFAKVGDMQAVISARDRPTSLARFALDTPVFGKQRKGGVRVRVKTGGGVRILKRGFFMKLKSGPILTEDRYNVGLAVRLKPGEKIQGSQAASPLGGGAYLLYGPSVAQVFDEVRGEISPEIADFAVSEFHRQFLRLSAP
jgi:hypothetical protein